MVRVYAFVVVLLAALGFAGWASDFITPQGERTVYTVDCDGGAWQGEHCQGRVEAGKRYRYRALRGHAEVLFWTLGTSEPSGKFADCTIQDGRNWACRPSADVARSITLRMVNGTPVSEPADATLPFRAVSKWRWLLLKRGITEKSVVAESRPHAVVAPPQ